MVTMMIERDGFPFIFGALACVILCAVGYYVFHFKWPLYLGLFFILLAIFVAYFFRSPNRSVTLAPGEIVSPADGKVIKIDRLESYDGFDGPVMKIAIFLSVFDVHVNWVPLDGVVRSVEYHSGAFHLAYVDKASDLNERTEIALETERGPVVFKQIAGTIARRIVCRLQKGQTVSGGEKFGMIKFGSRAELIYSVESETLIEIGQKVRGGETIIARLAENQATSTEDQN